MLDIPTSSAGIQLPDWIDDCISACVRIHADFSSPEKRIQFVTLLAKKNVQYQTGGPFAAAIFDMANQQLVAVGVNLVVASCCSNNHAEMVAIALAQAALQTHALHDKGRFELVTSCEPCAMCLGAIPWSGIQAVVCGATAQDAEAIGFDEGPKHPDWVHQLEQRGIQVSTHISRDHAAAVFRLYQEKSGMIYNGLPSTG